MHADRTNRILLLVLALLLVTAGAAAGAASIGTLGTATRHSPVIANPPGHFIGTQGDWLWPAAALAAVILALLALRWLLALLFSTDRAGDLPITPGGSAGRTTLAARALTEAVAEEVESYRESTPPGPVSSATPPTPNSSSPRPWRKPPTSPRCVSASKPAPSPTPASRSATHRFPPS